MLLDAEHRLEQGAPVCLRLAVAHPPKFESLLPGPVWAFPKCVPKVAQGAPGHLGLLLRNKVDHVGPLHRCRTLASFDEELKIPVGHPSAEGLAVQLAIADSGGRQSRGGELEGFTLGILQATIRALLEVRCLHVGNVPDARNIIRKWAVEPHLGQHLVLRGLFVQHIRQSPRQINDRRLIKRIHKRHHRQRTTDGTLRTDRRSLSTLTTVALGAGAHQVAHRVAVQLVHAGGPAHHLGRPGLSTLHTFREPLQRQNVH
mmetsp:Transcript_54892/g.126098  ORF Transcript_54892/g.126098 Transcript_54892/m.126098 type:complete len:259 (+) Transcript_54892:369-1145(+)